MDEEQVHEEHPRYSTSGSTHRGITAVVVLLLLIAMAAYAVHERNTAVSLAGQSAQISATLADTRIQVDALSAKLTSMETAARQVDADHAAPNSVRQRPRATQATAQRRRDDPRWKKVQEQLDAQNKQIGDTRSDLDSTKSELSNARTELGGSIARTHDELIVLQRRGEKSYYEFDLSKSKQFQKAGPVGVSLRKASTKDMFADLKLMVEDAQVAQKHVNLYQPVLFYAGDSGQPIELVINSISKNHIHGYISEAKYNKAALAAMAPSQAATAPGTQTDANAASPAAPPSPRRRLQLPPQ